MRRVRRFFIISMKRKFKTPIVISIMMLTLATCCFTSEISAQGIRRVEAVTEADPMPEYPGGIEAFAKYVNEHIPFPSNPNDLYDYVGKKIDIRLIVLKDGSVGPTTVFLPSNKINVGNIEKALQEGPKFKPGEVNGKPVNVRIMIPVILEPPVRE